MLLLEARKNCYCGAAQVNGGNGALAVHLMPRYMLQNLLDTPIQYKQQGTAFERELGTGKSRAIYWSDAARPLLLCMRVQEAGWLWSGGVSLEGPGDQFVKIRHRSVFFSCSIIPAWSMAFCIAH